MNIKHPILIAAMACSLMACKKDKTNPISPGGNPSSSLCGNNIEFRMSLALESGQGFTIRSNSYEDAVGYTLLFDGSSSLILTGGDQSQSHLQYQALFGIPDVLIAAGQSYTVNNASPTEGMCEIFYLGTADQPLEEVTYECSTFTFQFSNLSMPSPVAPTPGSTQYLRFSGELAGIFDVKNLDGDVIASSPGTLTFCKEWY